MTRPRTIPRIATIATMPGRRETFEQVLRAIHPQVDHMFIYLDGYAQPPEFLNEFQRITVRRAEQLGDLHASSRFLCLRELDEPAMLVVVDDDIAYPPDYVRTLGSVLESIQGKALVGVHGRIYLPPHRSYVNDGACVHYAGELRQPRQVHELGTGTLAFATHRFHPDPRAWDRYDMDDILVSIEAQRRGLHRYCIPRQRGWLTPLAEDQEDSLWVRTKQDDTVQSERMRELLTLYARQDAPIPPAPRQFHAVRESPRPA